jgi:Ca-activated chloride channel family protein
MKTKWIATVLAAALVAVTANARVRDAAPDSDETLSPFFSIENGDPSVDSLPLKETRVEANIVGVIAHVSVFQTYANNGQRPINLKYVFPASTRAAVHGMQMTIGNDVIKAKIKEREQARQEFETAKEEGKSASLLEQQRPNVFTMDVANVMPAMLSKSNSNTRS